MSAPQTPYLGAEAAALGDRELASPRVRRPVSDTILTELSYAADLFQRAERAVADELNRLAGAGILMDRNAALSASCGLSQLSAYARLQGVLAREQRGRAR